MDIMIKMEKVRYEELTESANQGGNSAEMRKSVIRSVDYAKEHGRTKYNSELSETEVRKLEMTKDAAAFFRKAYQTLHLSPRTYMKSIRVARTIADLDQSEIIEIHHLSEALSYRTALDDLYRKTE